MRYRSLVAGLCECPMYVAAAPKAAGRRKKMAISQSPVHGYASIAFAHEKARHVFAEGIQALEVGVTLEVFDLRFRAQGLFGQ